MNQILFNTLISASLYCVVSISFSLIYYTTKAFYISQAIIITSAAYSCFFLLTYCSTSLFLSVIGAIAISTIIGLLSEILIYKHLRQPNTANFNHLIASIGVYIILQNCISLFFGDDTKVINNADATVGHQYFGAYITTIQVITIVVSIVLFIAISLLLNFTATGKSIRAVASNSELCNIYGTSSNKIILIAFGIGSALAATAGILSAMDTNMTPTFGFNLLLYGVVAMIIGGVGSTRGLIAGSLLVATAQHLAAYYLDTKWMDAVTYVILIIFLIWKPLGFSGNRLKKVEV